MRNLPQHHPLLGWFVSLVRTHSVLVEGVIFLAKKAAILEVSVFSLLSSFREKKVHEHKQFWGIVPGTIVDLISGGRFVIECFRGQHRGAQFYLIFVVSGPWAISTLRLAPPWREPWSTAWFCGMQKRRFNKTPRNYQENQGCSRAELWKVVSAFSCRLLLFSGPNSLNLPCQRERCFSINLGQASMLAATSSGKNWNGACEVHIHRKGKEPARGSTWSNKWFRAAQTWTKQFVDLVFARPPKKLNSGGFSLLFVRCFLLSVCGGGGGGTTILQNNSMNIWVVLNAFPFFHRFKIASLAIAVALPWCSRSGGEWLLDTAPTYFDVRKLPKSEARTRLEKLVKERLSS